MYFSARKTSASRWHKAYQISILPSKNGAARIGTGRYSASHLDLPRIYFTTEANAGEYDIPPAFYTPDQPKIAGYPQIGPYPELSYVQSAARTLLLLLLILLLLLFWGFLGEGGCTFFML